MISPLTTHAGAAVFAPRLFGSVAYYASLTSYAHALIDYDIRYDKRAKGVHRYRIADTRGPLELTVPVSRPSGACTPQGISWNDVTVSPHGQWWAIHRQALESAYGRTPFFEFWHQRIWPLLSEHSVGLPVAELVRRANTEIFKMLGLEDDIGPYGTDALNFRYRDFSLCEATEYYQVRSGALGFLSHLSILDLLFNVGPEAVFVLREQAKQL